MEGIKKARIWTAIPPHAGEIWQVKVPPVKKDLYNAVFWTAKKEKNFDESTTFFDYRILGEITDAGAKKLLAEVYTAPHELKDRLRKVFAKAGFPLFGITLSSYALQNLFTSHRLEADNDVSAVMLIGPQSSCIDIHRRDQMLLSRVIKTGMGSMAESILEAQGAEPIFGDQEERMAERLSSPEYQEALAAIARLEEEKSGAAPGGEAEGASSEDIFEMISPALERLARQVERTIDHAVNVLGNPSPARLYLCGGLATAPRVTAFFQDQLGLAVEKLDPLNPSMPYVAPAIASMKKRERVALVLAVGLAMSIEGETPNLLFTAIDRQIQKIAKRNAKVAGVVMLIAFLAAGGYWFQAAKELSIARLKTAALQKSLDAQTPLLTQARISQMDQDYTKRAAELREYVRRFVPMAVMSELSAATPANIQLLDVRLDMEKPGAKEARFMVVEGIIRGEGISFETHLSSYLFRIRSSPLFGDSVIQKTSDEEFGKEGKVLRFVINVNLEQVKK